MNSLARLRELISDASHSPLCAALNHNPITGDFIGGDCNCWKAQAQQEVDLTWAVIQHHQRFAFEVGEAFSSPHDDEAIALVGMARDKLRANLRELLENAS